MTVFFIKGFNDETYEFDCGIATTEEKANLMIAELEKEFEGAFEFTKYEQKLDVLNIDDNEIQF